MTKLTSMIASMILTTSLPLPSRATMLVVIYTDDGYWIGADSYRDFHGGKPEIVCKVHDTKFGLLLKGGASQGKTVDGEDYSIDQEVKDTLESSRTVGEFKNKLRQQIVHGLDVEIEYMLNGINATADNIEEFPMAIPLPSVPASQFARNISLFEPGATTASGELLLVQLESPQDPKVLPRTEYHYVAHLISDWTPIAKIDFGHTDPEHEYKYPPSVRMLVKQVTYDKPDAWVRRHPQKALTEILDIGHQADPNGIGKPYVIVHVVRKQDGGQDVAWLSKSVCPGWSTDLHPNPIQRNQPTFLRRFLP